MSEEPWKARCARVKLLAGLGEYDRARDECAKAAEVAPDRRQEAKVYFDLGDVLFHQQDYDNAFWGYDQAIRVNPEYSEAHHYRGRVHLVRQELDRAIADFDQSIELGAAYGFWTYSYRAFAHLRKGKCEKAETDFSKAIELAPGPYPRYLRALARLSAGDVQGYRSDCSSMLEHFGQAEDGDTADQVAWTCALAPDAVADFSGLITLAEKAVEIDPESGWGLNTLGGVLYRAGRFEEAIQQLAEADKLAKDPAPGMRSSPAYTWFFLAMAHHQLGHHEEAKEWFDKVVASTDKVMQQSPWNRQLTLKLLRDEAQALLDVTSEDQKSGDSPQNEAADKAPQSKQGID